MVSFGWDAFGVSVGRGVEGFGPVLEFGRLGVTMVGVARRACMVGEGFHALHWNMLSWFSCCINGLRGFIFGCVRRDVGGWILCFERVRVGWVMGRWGSRMGESHSLGFFGGCCDSILCVGGWLWVWLLVMVGVFYGW